jgi:CheY-like chemotaxis protein/HPt (histidine-containing phosphotransfer) domain-containing protein
MDNLGIECTVSTSLGSYIPTGRKEYFFIEEYYYTYSVKDFFASHPDTECMVLIKPGSDFTPDRPNVHIMDRPNTTMKLVNIFNNRFGESGRFDEDKIFSADFTAPSAQILVVDDNDINLSIAEGLMSPLKVKVDKADGGRKAIEMAAAKDYDIIFMDHMMPEVDGVDATKAIRKNGTDPRKPVIIALSANAMEEARKLFAESGMNDFVAKPIDVRILTSKIKEWLPAEKIVEGVPSELGTAVPEPSAIVSLSMEELDTETAIRALGSPELYDKIAGEYFRCGEEKLASIKQAFDSEDWENYTIRVHALKSSSRQIGAMDLGSKAEALEKAGKAGDIDKIKADTDALLSDYKALLDKMSSFYEKPEEEASDKPPIDEDTLDKILEDIESACEDLDFDVLEEATGKLNEYSYEGAMKEGIDELAEAVGSMDTDACLEAVGKIRSAK